MMMKAIIQAKHLQINEFTSSNFPLLHSKQQQSLSNAVIGVLERGSLIRLSEIGIGIAESKGLLPKHAKKQKVAQCFTEILCQIKNIQD